MRYSIVRAREVRSDIESIYDHLVRSHLSFGESIEIAREKTERRVSQIAKSFEALGSAPFQGTLRPELGPLIRNVTKDRAVIYFRSDRLAKEVLIMAVFFGGQDHQSAMLKRMRKGGA